MTNDIDPLVGNWYQHVDKGLDFEVVAVDYESALVEIQYLDGTVDEISLEEWYELVLEPAEPPEDWTAPLDVIDDEAADTGLAADGDDWDEEPAVAPPRLRSPRLDDDLLPDDPANADWD